MIRTVFPGRVRGTVIAPSSKSLTQRAIAAALLSDGTTVILNPSESDDSNAALRMALRLGAVAENYERSILVKGSTTVSAQQVLHCGESGLALRMFAPVATLFTEKVVLTGEGSLLGRPVEMITNALSKMGVETETNDGFLPLIMKGRLSGGNYRLDGSAGSQIITGLLMALPVLETDSVLIVDNLKSKPYVMLTLELLSKFGVRVESSDLHTFYIPGNQRYTPCEYNVEGDWSGAAALLVAGAIAGSVEVENLSVTSKQADIAVIDAIRLAGGEAITKNDRVVASQKELRAFEFDATESPDLFPPLAALAAACQGTTCIKGVSRLKHKESDRALSIMDILKRLGIDCYVKDDCLIITGAEPKGAAVSSHHDHRIAMMASLIALKSKGNVIISEAEAVAKSYPGFYDDMKALGVFIR